MDITDRVLRFRQCPLGRKISQPRYAKTKSQKDFLLSSLNIKTTIIKYGILFSEKSILINRPHSGQIILHFCLPPLPPADSSAGGVVCLYYIIPDSVQKATKKDGCFSRLFNRSYNPPFKALGNPKNRTIQIFSKINLSCP